MPVLQTKLDGSAEVVSELDGDVGVDIEHEHTGSVDLNLHVYLHPPQDEDEVEDLKDVFDAMG
ncbi:MAG: hypothetical protein SV760_08505 [Halobacteria archaeon]|nr:hypothetical protein [Halobacteria archaeon]